MRGEADARDSDFLGGGRSYVYNALGQQVEWSNLSFDFVYDQEGRWVYFINEIDGSQTYSEIPFLGARYLGSYRNDGTHLTHANLLGSTTMETNASGGVMEDLLFYPWGQFWQQTAATGWSFASMPYRDQPLGHDLTPNRIYDYGTAPGRWLSPDPLAGDVMSPQSLNRYAYVLNNPTSLIDPLGLCPPSNPDCPGPGRENTGGFNDAFTSNSPCSLDFISISCAALYRAIGAGITCFGSCSQTVTGSNGLPYTIVQTAGNPDIYGPNGELISDQGAQSVAEVFGAAAPYWWGLSIRTSSIRLIVKGAGLR